MGAAWLPLAGALAAATPADVPEAPPGVRADARTEAGSGATPARLDAIVVTATRRGTPASQVPASVSVRGAPGPSPGVNLSEWLGGIPGLLARDRQNYAQDTQVSIRGFGTRASFGIRGLRVLIDDIPATQPDGQSQVSHANLASAETVEVLRGPFSALYGLSSGGVIRLDSGEGRDPFLATAGFASGGGRDRRLSAGLRSRWNGGGAVLGASVFRSDGQRPQSAARRESFNARLHLDGPGLALVFNHFDSPLAEDPLGLTPAQFAADPFQTAAPALAFDTRKTVRQDQAGLVWTRGVGGLEAKLVAHAGRREVLQFLSVPVAAQANPLQSGGVVDLASDYGGVELQLGGGWRAGAGDWRWTTGLAWDALWQQRRGFENFDGATLGVRGRLRRDERNRVASLDPYLQVEGPLSPRWSLLAGLRHSTIRYRSRDDYVTGDNPDDSGEVAYSRLAPVAGLRFAASPALAWHASLGAGFETPTLVELAYRPDGGSGLNLGLRPARSRNAELGLKWQAGADWRLEAAAFRIDTRGELVVATNLGGRASFANAGRTRRQGLELAVDGRLHETLGLRLAWTALDARVREDYAACAGAPCPVPDRIVDRGSRLAGIPRQAAQLRLDWRPAAGWALFAEARAVGDVVVDDLGSARAPGHALLDVGLSRAIGPATAWLRLDNVADRRHVGSVIVNDGNGRWFEPGPRRTLWLGLDLALEGRD